MYTKMQENTFSCIKTRKAYESPKKVFNVMRTSCCLTALLLREHFRMYFLIICIHSTSTFSQYFIFFYFFFTAGLKMCTQIVLSCSVRKMLFIVHMNNNNIQVLWSRTTILFIFKKVVVIVFYFHTIRFCIICEMRCQWTVFLQYHHHFAQCMLTLAKKY